MPSDDHDHHHDHHHGGHGHTHGVIDPSITTTERGIWAVKWSFVGLMITAVLQTYVVWLSSSVALLADTIHNFGDASTAIPLWIAFALARRPANKRFPYGYGRVEDLAGVAVVLTILFSAIVAGYETVQRLLHPQEVHYIGALVAASIVGFLGNELVAIFRIRVGKEIGSVALVADGHHARVDGMTSLAVHGRCWRACSMAWNRKSSTRSATQRTTHPVSRTSPRCGRAGWDIACAPKSTSP
jgi:divalent metal cation (Fe/Co/Zn/Cd) transporter